MSETQAWPTPNPHGAFRYLESSQVVTASSWARISLGFWPGCTVKASTFDGKTWKALPSNMGQELRIFQLIPVSNWYNNFGVSWNLHCCLQDLAIGFVMLPQRWGLGSAKRFSHRYTNTPRAHRYVSTDTPIHRLPRSQRYNDTPIHRLLFIKIIK